MDVEYNRAHAASSVDDWLARFSPATGSTPSAFPFTSHKIQFIESRRARMSDLLIFDVLLIRGGIRNPDIFFPPTDWASLGNLLDVIDQSTYDILKKDCLVYILLKWAWEIDAKETNLGWELRYLQERCLAPQFAALADAYWLLDTGTRLSKAVSILSDARLNRDYVSKVLQALSLSSSPASFVSSPSPATAALVVKYIRTAKPLLTEPDDIDLYALSLAQLSFMDAWAYQKSFPEGSSIRERLLGRIIGWCLMPIPKQQPIAQLLAFPLSSYEQSFMHSCALPSQFSTSPSLSSVNTHIAPVPFKPVLSPQAISTLQDLICVRTIQSGDYVEAIKLDREFSSILSGSSSSIASQDRKSVIQDLFATLPLSERTLLEDEIGKVAAGVRVNPSTSTVRQNTSAPTRKPLVAELSLSASWEDVGATMGSPAPSASGSLPSSAVGATFAGKAAPAPVSTIGGVSQPSLSMSASASPFASHVSRPPFGHHAPPTPKFTAFGSPIPPTTGASTRRGVITERAKMLFSGSTIGGSSPIAKPAARVSLFDTTGSAKNAANAFYKPPSGPAARTSIDVSSVLASTSISKHTEQALNATKQNGHAQQGESDGEDVSMGSGSDVEIVEEDRRDGPRGEEQEREATTDEDEETGGDFLTYDKSIAADLTLDTQHVDRDMVEGHGVRPELAFSVFSWNGAVQNGSRVGQGENLSGSERASHASPPRRPRLSSSREGGKSLDVSVTSTTNKSRAPPGAFHAEDEDEDGDKEDEEDDHMLQTPTHSPLRGTRTRRESETPSRPSHSQPQLSSKSTAASTGRSRPSARSGRTSSRNLSHSIPGALMDEVNDVHEQDAADHMDTHGDEDTEMDEQGEDDAIAPLPSRPSRRTRSSGFFGTSAKSKSSGVPMPPVKATAPTAATKGKSRARLSEAKTPTRRSSRLSMASSGSPDHVDPTSPTKRKSTSSKVSIAGSGSGTVPTRSSTRRKR